MYMIESYFSDLRSPLLFLECVLSARLLLCEYLVVSLQRQSPLIENFLCLHLAVGKRLQSEHWLNIPVQTGSILGESSRLFYLGVTSSPDHPPL